MDISVEATNCEVLGCNLSSEGFDTANMAISLVSCSLDLGVPVIGFLSKVFLVILSEFDIQSFSGFSISVVCISSIFVLGSSGNLIGNFFLLFGDLGFQIFLERNNVSVVLLSFRLFLTSVPSSFGLMSCLLKNDVINGLIILVLASLFDSLESLDLLLVVGVELLSIALKFGGVGDQLGDEGDHA